MDGWIEFLTSIVDTVNTKAKQYQECETLITRIEVRIMRLRREKGDRIKGALQCQDYTIYRVQGTQYTTRPRL